MRIRTFRRGRSITLKVGRIPPARSISSAFLGSRNRLHHNLHHHNPPLLPRLPPSR
jgi:hypothetical protein